MGIQNTLRKLSHSKQTFRQLNIGLQLPLVSSKAVSSCVLKALGELNAARKHGEATIILGEESSNKAAYQKSQETRLKKETVLDGDDNMGQGENLETSRVRSARYWLEQEKYSDDPIPDEYRPDKKAKSDQTVGPATSDDCTYVGGGHNLSAIEAPSQTSGRHESTILTASVPESGLCFGHSTVVSGQSSLEQDISGSNTVKLPVIPPGPYPFMKNQFHPAPEKAQLDNFGLGIDCPDGCADCEIWVSSVAKAKARVDNWFEKDFNWRDEGSSSFNYPETETIQNIPDDPVEDYDDWLLGATDSNDFPHIKQLYKWAVENTPGAMTAASVTRNMRNGEREHWWLLPYYHGTEYNVIMAEYEPRYIPNDYRSWPFDARLPIWEARGLVGPGQLEEARWEHTKIEHQRQWTMYRWQDEARQRYIAEVTEYARWQFIHSGHLPWPSQ
ncbi:hypothetical protein PISL3812_02192 [Talaromyces islandicus]|uniref:Uncharacterized protein n=1 Tax=Talaromyces islandicus TaxID=28573 RepID=A0A0U1LRG4_TALIS|nr:hypothetical protein PISL3812_02192 [Talaromyces islandicus]